MKRTIWSLGIATVAIVIAVAAGRPGTFNATTAQEKTATEPSVKIDNFTFSPGTITVAAGSTVRWTNHDDIPHNVVSTDKSFKSKAIGYGREFQLHVHQAGDLQLLLLDPPEDDGKSRCAVRRAEIVQ
ncbi:MAG: plastocyanin/azurin family copper-binding protein [Candidatus Angelobacter sp.]